jgi:Uma2 family endonuclease
VVPTPFLRMGSSQMSTAPKYIPHYTVEDYQLWEGDWELWDGVAIAMTPSPFGKHGSLLMRIGTALSIALHESNCDANAIAEVDWIVSDDTVVRPDLSLVCGAPPERHIESAPALVVEILSASTRERDLHWKRDLFQQQSVPWYLIIDTDNDTLDPLRLDEKGVYQSVECDHRLKVDLCGHCVLDVHLERLFG